MSRGRDIQVAGGDDGASVEATTILVIDDDEDLLEVTTRYLERDIEAAEVHTERLPSEALERVRAGHIDCIVADYQMPEMDGLAVLEAVRETHPDLPFILFTGRGSEEVASEAISAGVDDYVQKTGTPEQFELLATRIGTLVDQQRTRAALERNEARFTRLIEHSPTVTRTITADGILTYVSPSAEDVLGYHPDELAGRNGFEFIHEEDRDRVRAALDRLEDTAGEIDTVEYRYRHGDGDWHWVRSTGRNLLDDPAVEAFVINTEDISERKAHEQELERQNERLEAFASVVSHDLRNPLNVVLGTAEMARDDPTSDDMARIESSAKRMDALIDDLLTLARQGEVVGDPRPTELAAIARRVWNRMETADGTLSIEGRPGMVTADPDRLEQLFQNLFANAHDHADSAVTVTVGATPTGFFVADDGPGVPATDRQTVFERGYSTSESGTGFGLAIVQSIVEAHGWEIDLVESTGGGARFEISDVEFPSGTAEWRANMAE